MITRQDAETEIPELAGTLCQGVLGVGTSIEEGITALFLKAEDAWYRIYIDVGVLFWNPGEPDPEAELAGDERFLDLLEPIEASSLRIERVRMHAGELHVQFAGQHALILAEHEDGGLLRVRID